jgi:predicted O-methyltransferase YrrM
MSFTEEWFDSLSQDRLATLARSVDNVPGIIVEIGSWEGRSTCVLANAIRPRPVIAVDTWHGSPGEISAELAAKRDVFGQFITNVKVLTGGNVCPVRKGWREFVPTISDPVALCFIDAEHTYTEVRDNIAAILPLMAPGGIICGDDAGHPPVRQAVLEMLHPNDDVLVLGNVWSFVVPNNYTAPARPSLASLYEQQCATPSDIYLHLPRFVEMVKAGNATKVIELGTRTGVSTIAFLYALEQTGGHLWSVDIDAKPPIGDYPHWTFIQGDDESDEVLSQLPPNVDILFLDTSHHYEHTLRELRLYRSQVKSGGLIVCHDTELPVPEGAPATDPVYPVKRAIEQFIAETGFRWINVPECWGLGIIEVV